MRGQLAFELTPSELQILESLLGRSVAALYTRAVDVYGCWTSADYYCIPRPDDFIMFGSEQRELFEGTVDAYELRVETVEQPPGIAIRYEESGRRLMVHPLSTVQVGVPPSPIVSIAVLQTHDSSRLGRAVYDAALVFSLEDGRQFTLSTKDSILGGLECTTDIAAIQEAFAGYETRVLIAPTRGGAATTAPPQTTRP
jgi:hypothetical protein